MKRLLFLSCLLALPAYADVTGPGGKVIECYCTDTQGARVEIGDQICMFVDGRAFMALCDMSLNVPIWRDTGAGCLSSRAEPELQFSKPTIEPLTVRTPI